MREQANVVANHCLCSFGLKVKTGLLLLDSNIENKIAFDDGISRKVAIRCVYMRTVPLVHDKQLVSWGTGDAPLSIGRPQDAIAF